ncbi:polyadenylation and cleavage factor homolog 11 [Galendromus occidentalis]|uniref:Polyadenylation and cleavage factor homolog 11 n=1 Tax=Galendromus occidentalis TaxID=34638 RepID=A0AAJ7SHE3_9ACAR|nr:polyadenylation and cleavage factor homolog 11 [Galendromus occidentalis]
MEESAVNEYASSLSELVTNSKPLISMLTILADENKAHAAKIAQVIQKYLEKSPTKIKLLSLYLIDSIVKNVREPYIQIFSENLVPMFTEVFEGGDEKVRAALFKLRQTWKGIFSESKLYLVDISTKRMDPQWPITTSTESLRAPIHLNPKFFLRQTNGIPEKTSETTESEKVGDEKSDRPHSNPEDSHRDDRGQINLMSADAGIQKRTDPRLKKKDSGEKKTSSKTSARHQESSEKRRPSPKSSSRSSTQKSDHKKAVKRTSEEPTSLEPSLADKEAAAILSGDVDLRLLAPVTKKPKHELQDDGDLPIADVDLRIRPEPLEGESGSTLVAVKTEVAGAGEAVDTSTRRAKTKGRSKSHSTKAASQRSVSSGGHNRVPQGGAASQPDSSDPKFSDRNLKPKGAPEMGLPAALKNKGIRVSDPAPDSGQIRLDGRMREVRFVDGIAVAIIEEVPPNLVRARQIMFRGGSKKIIINDTIEVLTAFDGREHDFNLNGNRHRIRFGAPLRELYIDGIPYACQFNGVPIYVRSREDVFSVTLHPPCPSVNDKMEATPELLNKLGLKPLLPNPTTPFVGAPFQGMPTIPGHPAVNGTNSGGWIRYQDELNAPANLPPGIFPPMPGALGLAQHTAFPGSNLFCAPSHLATSPYGAYQMLPTANLPMPVVQAPVQPSATTAVTAPNPEVNLNVSDLLSKLVNAGIIGSGDSKPDGEHNQPKPKEVVKEDIPRLTFKKTDLLKKRYNGVISALHDGMQCATCGQRFSQAEKSSDKYAQHLDWHFRSARRGREGLKKASSRKWFYQISDWKLFEEVEDIDDRARSYFEIQEAQHDNPTQEIETSDVQEVPTVSAKHVDQNENNCFLCHEAFDLFFCEESEEWRLRNAVISDGKVFHPICYEDFIRPTPDPIVPKKETATECAEPMEVENPTIKAEVSEMRADETSQPLPGLDFAPPSTKEIQREVQVKQEPEENPEGDATEQPSEAGETCEDENDPNDTIQLAEQTVIVEDLGELGVHSESTSAAGGDDESTQNSESVDPVGARSVTSPENVSQDSQSESKVIVKSTGGIVLKVNFDSKANGDNSAADASVAEEPELEQEVEWTPPTPDPAYKTCAPVRKGTEESGLCSIM